MWPVRAGPWEAVPSKTRVTRIPVTRPLADGLGYVFGSGAVYGGRTEA